MAIRVAVTGRTATPPLFDTLVALGRERTLDRLDRGGARAGGDRRPDPGAANGRCRTPLTRPSTRR